MKHLLSTTPSHHFQVVGCAVVAMSAALAAVVTATPAGARGLGVHAPATPMAKARISHSVNGGNPSKLRDPAANVAASPDYLYLCAVKGPRNQECIDEALKAINHARAGEGIHKMILPTNFSKLSLANQTFVITDLERVARGLRPFTGLTAQLNKNAHHAAVVRDDPTLVGAILTLLGVRRYASIWAGDFGPLASDYDWMYNDGYAGKHSVNIDCRHPGQSGCWGHRDAILGLFTGLPNLLAGASAANGTGSSLAEVLVGGVGHVPAFTYTWKEALRHGANGHKITTHG